MAKGKKTGRSRGKLKAQYLKGYQAGRRKGYREGYKEGRSGLPEVIAAPLDRDFVNDLIALCHPDRHEGRVRKANAVTARLLNLRRAAFRKTISEHETS